MQSTPPATTVDLSGFSSAERDALENHARNLGVSLDDACLQILVDHAQEIVDQPALRAAAGLNSFPVAH